MITPSEWTPDRLATAKRLWATGMSASRIAEYLGLGVTKNAVLGKLHRNGVNGDGRPKKPHKPRAPRPSRAKAPHPPSRASTVGLRAVAKSMVPPLGGIILADLTDRCCHWPLGEPKSPDFRYCGGATDQAPYCAAHRAIAYIGYSRPKAQPVRLGSHRR